MIGLYAPLCCAFDSASLEFADSNRTQVTRIGVQRNWGRRLYQYDGSHVTGYWDVAIAYWRADQYRDHPGETQNIVAAGVTPVFRLEPDKRFGSYAEMGIGAQLLSARYNNNGRQLSTHFQFGTHLGVGYVFRSTLDIGVQFQHVSNGGIKEPNSGVNYLVLRVARRF